MQLSAVDLPQPDGPSSAMNSPRLIVIVSSDSALNALPPAPAKRRVTRSSRSSLKSCFMDRTLPWMSRIAVDPRSRTVSPRARTDAVRRCTTQRSPTVASPASRDRTSRYLVFCAPTCWSQMRNASTCAFGVSDCVCGNSVEPLLVLRPAVLLDRVLALLRRHRQRHVLHRRTRVEVALVVRVRLRLRRQHERHQVEHDGELLRRHALRHHHVVRVVDPGHALERRDLEVLRHDAEHARVDVPAGHRHRHVARAFAELLHHRAGAGRVVLDAAVELLEVRPRLVPAVDRILRILVAEDVRQPHDERAARTRVRRPRVDQLVRIRLAPREQLLPASSAPA